MHKKHPFHSLFPFFLSLMTVLLVAPLLATQVLAAPRTRIDSGGQVPFYARIGENETFSDGDWTVVIFYRPPECIPGGFNLNQFFHFPGENDEGAFACQPATTEGFEIWEGEPGSGPAPLRAHLRGLGAVPVWFVDTDSLHALIEDDGVFTIGDLEGLNPLKGTADSYYEVLHPSQSNEKSVVIFRASGVLENGNSFWARASYIGGKGQTRISLEP
jgi:hypothetical protein